MVIQAIYSRINEAIEQFLREHVVSQIMDSSVVGYDMMSRFSRAWEDHKIMVNWIQMLFRHLDKGYVHNNTLPTLTSCGMQKFLSVAFGGTRQRVRTAVLDLVNKERDGETVDRSKLRTCIEVFMVMGITEESTVSVASLGHCMVVVGASASFVCSCTRCDVHLPWESASVCACVCTCVMWCACMCMHATDH